MKKIILWIIIFLFVWLNQTFAYIESWTYEVNHSNWNHYVVDYNKDTWNFLIYENWILTDNKTNWNCWWNIDMLSITNQGCLVKKWTKAIWVQFNNNWKNENNITDSNNIYPILYQWQYSYWLKIYTYKTIYHSLWNFWQPQQIMSPSRYNSLSTIPLQDTIILYNELAQPKSTIPENAVCTTETVKNYTESSLIYNSTNDIKFELLENNILSSDKYNLVYSTWTTINDTIYSYLDINNVEDLIVSSWALIDDNIDIEFNSLELLPWLPTIHYKWWLIQYFEIKWEWNYFRAYINEWEYLFNAKYLEYNKRYFFKNALSEVNFEFKGSYSITNKISKLDYWELKISFEDKEVCIIPDSEEVYIEWELFDWTKNDLDNNWLSNQDLNSTTTSVTANESLFNIVTENKLETVFDLDKTMDSWFTDKINEQISEKTNLNDYIEFWDLTIPNEPNLSISVPKVWLNSNWIIDIQWESQINFDIIEDRLWVLNWELEDNMWWKAFISIILAIIYLVLRLVVLRIMFYILTLFYRYIHELSKLVLWGTSLKYWSGNLWSMIPFIIYIVAVWATTLILLSYILASSSVFNKITDWLTTLFTFLSVNTWIYELFQNIVNWFAYWIIVATPIFIIYSLFKSFWKIN